MTQFPIIAALLEPQKFPDSDSMWMPKQASTLAPDLDWLYFALYWLCVVLALGIIVAMAYLVLKFKAKGRSSKERIEPSTDHSTSLEIAWSVIPLPIVLAMFYFGFVQYVDFRTPPKGASEIHVTGQKWAWSFTHKNGCSDNKLHVPVNKDVRLIISSVDVLHSVWIPNFRVKMDAVPGRYTDLWFNATQTGDFPLECTEYCGTSHSDMLSRVIVQSESEFEAYLEECTKIPEGPEGGKILFERKGCPACHAVDGTKKVGPALNGIWGKTEALTSGSATVDENYIRESILEPQAKIVAGYSPAMPTYKGQLSDGEITAIIEYIKSLK